MAAVAALNLSLPNSAAAWDRAKWGSTAKELSSSGAPTYYFTSRDAFRWDNMTTTDIAFTYAFVIPTLGTDLQFYLEPRVTNVFNEHAVLGGNTTVRTRNSGTSYNLAAFNPFTTTPVECQFYSHNGSKCLDGTSGTDNNVAYDHTDIPQANWMKGPSFGKPTTPGNYQAPRTIVVSLGVRF